MQLEEWQRNISFMVLISLAFSFIATKVSRVRVEAIAPGNRSPDRPGSKAVYRF